MPVLSCIKLSQDELAELNVMAWQVIDNAIKYQELIFPAPPNNMNLEQKAATFVTLYLSGELKGCIGCYQSSEPLWRNVCRHVYSSAYEDNRFTSITADEVEQLTMELSILSQLSPIKNNGEQALIKLLVPKKDGLLLQNKSSSAIFLPSVWRSLESSSLFVKALKKKAGWLDNYWSHDIEVFIFSTRSYSLKM